MGTGELAEYFVQIMNIDTSQTVKPSESGEELEIAMAPNIDPDSVTLLLASPKDTYSHKGILVLKKDDVKTMNLMVADIIKIKIARFS